MNNNLYSGALVEQFIHTESDRVSDRLQRGAGAALIKSFASNVLQVVREGLIQDGRVYIHNFGTFRLKMAPERTGRHPQSGERITIPAHPRVMFRPAKALREIIEQASPVLNVPAFPHTGPDAEDKTERLFIPPVPVLPPQTPDSGETEEITLTIPQTGAQLSSRHYQPPAPTINTASLANDISRPTGDPEMIRVNQAAMNTLNIDIVREEGVETGEFKPEISYTEHREGSRKVTVYYRTGVIAGVMLLIALSFWLFRGPSVQTPATTQETALIESTTAAVVTTGPELSPAQDLTASAIEPSLAITEAAPQPAVTPAIVEPTSFENIDTAEAIQPGNVKTEPLVFFNQTTHRIMDGDSLWKLSVSFYHDPYIWPHIYLANINNISNPDRIEVNDIVTLPQLEGPPTKLTDTDRRNIAMGYFMLYQYYKTTSYQYPHHALLGVKWYDKEVLKQNLDKVETIDANKLLGNSKENRLITAAFEKNQSYQKNRKVR